MRSTHVAGAVTHAANGIHIETSRSGHDIQSSEPGLVINAIRFVLDRVRANERP